MATPAPDSASVPAPAPVPLLHPAREWLCPEHKERGEFYVPLKTFPVSTNDGPSEFVDFSYDMTALKFYRDPRRHGYLCSSDIGMEDEYSVDQVDVFVVHGPCPDGLASAGVLLDRRGELGKVYATTHEELARVTDEFKGKTVCFIDICPRQEDIKRWEMKDYFVADHHPAAAELGDQSKVLYAPRECGATLAWFLVTGTLDFPAYLRAVRSCDTYNFKTCPNARVAYTAMENLQPFGAAKRCAGCHRRAFYQLCSMLTPEVIEAEQMHRAECQDLAKTACKRWHGTTPAYVLRTEDYRLVSDACHAVLTTEDWDAEDRRRGVAVAARKSPNEPGVLYVSVRSLDEQLGLARTVARAHGGNGHPCAAGFSCTEGELDAIFSAEAPSKVRPEG